MSQPAIEQLCSAAAGQTQLLEPDVVCNAAVGVVDLSRASAMAPPAVQPSVLSYHQGNGICKAPPARLHPL